MTAILIIGESGSGKSTAIRTLNPTETFIINVLDKPLPFKGWRKNYIIDEEGKGMGNYLYTDEYLRICSAMKYISKHRTDIKNIILDDFQYLMANEFMRSTDKGYEKFTLIAKHAWEVISASNSVRSDLNIFYLSHSDTDANGKIKCKTIGKMLDDKIVLEGMFTIVFYSHIKEKEYVFQTQGDGNVISKSPIDMFEDLYIPNDLQYVVDKMDEYFNEDV